MRPLFGFLLTLTTAILTTGCQNAVPPPAAAPLVAAAAPVAAPPTLPKPTPPTRTEVPNFAEVAPGIYRGAAPTAAGLKKLKALGVRTVVDLRIEKKGQQEEAATAKELGLNRVRIPMGREAPTRKQTAQFLALLDNAENEPVFVHCQHGADRTGAMIGIYRATRDGWNFDRTYAEMRKYGFKPYLKELKGAVSEQCENRAKTGGAAISPQP